MKKLTMFVCLLMLTVGTFAAGVDEAIMKAFSKAYPGAKNVSWTNLDEGYKVFFALKDATYRIAYDMDGNVTESFKYYTFTGDNLPPRILSKINKNYPEYKITNITERSSEGIFEYVINIETDKKTILLNSDASGNMEVQSRFNKSE